MRSTDGLWSSRPFNHPNIFLSLLPGSLSWRRVLSSWASPPVTYYLAAEAEKKSTELLNLYTRSLLPGSWSWRRVLSSWASPPVAYYLAPIAEKKGTEFLNLYTRSLLPGSYSWEEGWWVLEPIHPQLTTWLLKLRRRVVSSWSFIPVAYYLVPEAEGGHWVLKAIHP